jgi:two-component sensor histidine kinase
MTLMLRVYLLMGALSLIGLGTFYFVYLIRYESRRNLNTIGLMLIALTWVFTSIMEVADENKTDKTFWYMAQYFALICVPPVWLAMSGHFVGLKRTAMRPLIIPCSIISLVLMVLFATNPLHGLVFRSLSVYTGGIAVMKVPGPVYFIYLTYIFVGCATGLLVVAMNVKNMSWSFKSRTTYIFAAVAMPLIGGLVDLFWPEALGDLDVAPIAALASCAFLYLGMARWRLLNPLPLARSDFIDKLADPVLVLDESSRIIYSNEQAKALALSLPANGAEELRGLKGGLERLTGSVMSLIPGQDAHLGDRTYKASVKPVLDKGRKSIARIISLNDVSELRGLTDRLEAKVRERTSDLENLTLDLEEEVEKVKTQEAKLLRSLEEKELLLREVNHRVKNNLQVISSLIRLQAMRTEGAEAKEALDSSLKRVKAICLVHDRMYGEGHALDRVDAGAYIKDIVNPLVAMGEGLGERIEVAVDGGGIGLSMDLAMNVGLIVNETVTNAYKHVFRPGLGSKLSVSLTDRGDEGIELTVLDDGPGIPENVPSGKNEGAGQGLGSSHGLGLGHGLGMSIIRSISERMGGTLSVGSGPGGLVRLAIPRSAVEGEG